MLHWPNLAYLLLPPVVYISFHKLSLVALLYCHSLVFEAVMPAPKNLQLGPNKIPCFFYLKWLEKPLKGQKFILNQSICSLLGAYIMSFIVSKVLILWGQHLLYQNKQQGPHCLTRSWVAKLLNASWKGAINSFFLFNYAWGKCIFCTFRNSPSPKFWQGRVNLGNKKYLKHTFWYGITGYGMPGINFYKKDPPLKLAWERGFSSWPGQ